MAPRWDPEVQAAVKQARAIYGVAPEPALVHAVIEKETIHGALPITGTREPNGHISYGPMQVQDSTATSLHGISDPTTLAVPSIGIRIGTFELARLMRLFPNDPARVVAAYNAGAGNAARNAFGRFFNQPYVDAVLGFLERFRALVTTVATAAAPAAPWLAIAAIAVLLGSRRRLAWGKS